MSASSRSIAKRLIAAIPAPVAAVVHHVSDIDVASGLGRLTGNSWHLRTTEGKIVLVLSGLEIFHRTTGETIRATPKVGRGFENVICLAFGGAPA